MGSALGDNASSGRRCALGCETWPDDDEYKICPVCGEDTSRYARVRPLSPPEAASRVAHIRFEDYYEHEHVPDLRPRPEEDLLCS